MNPYDGYEVKINERSELLIKGPGLMLGYLGKDRIGEWFKREYGKCYGIGKYKTMGKRYLYISYL